MDFDGLPLFDAQMSAELRDAGMGLAWDREARKPLAIEAMELTCKRFPLVWHDRLHETLLELEITEIRPMAVGSLWRNALESKWIETTNLPFQKSQRPRAHRRPGPVYRSLLYRDEGAGHANS